MSTHPNTILLLTLTPDNMSRKTYRDILRDSNTKAGDNIKIGDVGYSHQIMEDEYDSGYQISAQEGDIVIFDMITYGYGEVIEWNELEKRKNELEKWAKNICDKFKCNYKIFVTANYW